MARAARIIALGAIVVAASVGGYFLWRPESEPPVVGVVRAGDIVAELSALELSAAVVQARAALDAASANRDHVYAGVRAEEIEGLAAEIAKAKSRLVYAQQQLERTAYLARSDFASQQNLDQANNDVASARADVA